MMKHGFKKNCSPNTLTTKKRPILKQRVFDTKLPSKTARSLIGFLVEIILVDSLNLVITLRSHADAKLDHKSSELLTAN